ncbi:hypothetical protein [Ktedonospora formicarum]|uniref:Uncharacterized protein n=1 Tax=Ktedonospora formicarum TaxID=2778364 RepID=A0A8J3IDM9_9CHLR|nr:hypothetical protein [Ktedonospora formicarum]GHO50827.1 hypothetical protein KSX_89900 [Ktedonospora formicarum]
MTKTQLNTGEFWRALILFRKNEATYKLALGQCLTHFVEQNQTHISRYELAENFFDVYLLRLASGRPQLRAVSKQTKMETIIEQ